MKITKGNIYGLIDQFRIGHDINLTILEQDHLAQFIAGHLNPDKNIVEEREGMEKLITVSETKLSCVKKNLRALQHRCPHNDTEFIYSYDGMSLSKCNDCHKSLTS